MYNETLYEMRQYFFDNGEYLNYYNAWERLKNESWNYERLPSQVAQQTMKNVDKAFKSFFKLAEKGREGKYDATKVSPPSYLDKEGFYLLDFPNQMFQIRDDHLRIGVPKKFREEFGYEQKEIRIPFTYDEVRNKDIKRLQILPKGDAEYFEYRLVYEEEKMIEPDMTQPPFKCPNCDFVTESKSGFTQHYKGKHDGIPPTRGKVKCEYCDEYFGVPPSKKTQRTFCSMDCKSKWRSENMVDDEHPSWKGNELENVCSVCGELYRTSNEDSVFCSRECKGIWMSKNWIGRKHPTWEGGKYKRSARTVKKNLMFILHKTI